ncbi:MerR family transcriptional regulator [Streptomyces sp. MST-110588]|uniref:MerR family transcriptional regulator n=1 Tax=Streptomyces sp. MST-110588 TaxID=2833628 RepID=UPI001F5E1C7F|nr:MerR family transcriptional regulator [Streptomyces sp. MST-110588]UNO40928.1 MerR family transcriptional regulator [Streptomyces sp. MST-110588]
MNSDTHEQRSATGGEGSDPRGSDGLTVGRAAALVGVSVKALHHWDEIGLVRPSERTWAGYRVYCGDDVARIHRVLVYKELGFPLAEIGRILDDPEINARAHLRRQRSQLVERISRLQKMVDAVDHMLEASRAGMRLTPEQQVEIFGNDWQPAWLDEAEERWGDSAQWAQYTERAAGRTPDDWKDIAAATDALNAAFAAAKRAGVAPGSDEANALAERHRSLLSQYFDCTHSMHVCIGRRYVGEPGYADHFDAFAPGLTVWLRDVIFANAEAHGVDPKTAEWE